MTRRTGPSRAVIVDVDGVLSPVHPSPEGSPWGDEVVAGALFGPVYVSPAMCERLAELDRLPDVECWWLTSWTQEMRSRMTGFPGTEWPVVAEADSVRSGSTRRVWWKWQAVQDWLDLHPGVTAVAWCDDDLRGGRPAAVRREFARRGLSVPLLMAPRTSVGLTPAHLSALESWAR